MVDDEVIDGTFADDFLYILDELCEEVHLYGVDKIVTPAQTFSYGADGRVVVKDVELTLIPYYAWCHRGSGEMTVWLPQTVQATTVPNGR